MENKKVLNVRMPNELYDRLKKANPSNLSKALRKHLDKMIFDVKEAERLMSYCVACFQRKKFEELFVSEYCSDEQENSSTNYKVCKECVKKLKKGETFGDKTDREFQPLLKILLKKKIPLSLTIRNTELRLAKYYPEDYKISLGCFENKDINRDLREDIVNSNRMAIGDGILNSDLRELQEE